MSLGKHRVQNLQAAQRRSFIPYLENNDLRIGFCKPAHRPIAFTGVVLAALDDDIRHSRCSDCGFQQFSRFAVRRYNSCVKRLQMSTLPLLLPFSERAPAFQFAPDDPRADPPVYRSFLPVFRPLCHQTNSDLETVLGTAGLPALLRQLWAEPIAG